MPKNEATTENGGIPEAVKDEVVRMYLANAKNSEITEATGVERSSIYWILDQRGIEPNRQRKRGQDVDGATLVKSLVEAHREIGRLEHENEQLLVEMDRLKARLARKGQDATK
jgi:transposase-like protein